MLCDQITNPKNFLHGVFQGFESIVPKIQEATKFISSPSFTHTVELAHGTDAWKKLLPFARLPYPEMWFEIARADRIMWTDEPGPLQAKTKRVGWFLKETSKTTWEAHLFWSFEGDPRPEYPPLDKRKNKERETMLSIHKFTVNLSLDWHQFESEEEALSISQYFLTHTQTVREKAGDRFAEFHVWEDRRNWEGEGGFLITAIGLMNTKNLYEKKFVDNKGSARSRRARGLLPFYDYHILKVRDRFMTTTKSGEPTLNRGKVRMHFVEGHFKVRKTGVFWWSSFSRGDPTLGFVDKDYEV